MVHLFIIAKSGVVNAKINDTYLRMYHLSWPERGFLVKTFEDDTEENLEESIRVIHYLFGKEEFNS
jgi:hypothetical protein